MQDKIILGMLMLRPLTVYDLRKAMRESTEMFYNTSIGSIHPACQKLLRLKYVEARAFKVGKRAKIEYSITESGRQYYKEWLTSPLGIGKIKEEFLLRLFFFADTNNNQEWRSVIQGYLDEVRRTKGELIRQKQQFDQMEIPDALRRVAFFRLGTLDLGYDYYCFLEDWLETFLAKNPPLIEQDTNEFIKLS
jgi:DNA-binding PadR family transcriptional regulator